MGTGPVARGIRARSYESRCRGFEFLLAQKKGYGYRKKKPDPQSDDYSSFEVSFKERPNQIDLSILRNSVGYVSFIAPFMSCHIEMDYLKSVEFLNYERNFRTTASNGANHPPEKNRMWFLKNALTPVFPSYTLVFSEHPDGYTKWSKP